MLLGQRAEGQRSARTKKSEIGIDRPGPVSSECMQLTDADPHEPAFDRPARHRDLPRLGDAEAPTPSWNERDRFSRVRIEQDKPAVPRGELVKNRLTENAPHAKSEHVHRCLEIEPVLDLGLRDWRHDVLHLPRNASPLIQPEMIPAHDLHGFGHDPRKSMERRDGSVDAWKQQHATTSGRPLTNDLPRQRRLDLRKNLDATSAIHDAQVISDFIVETSPESRVNQIEETRSDSIIRSKHIRIDHFVKRDGLPRDRGRLSKQMMQDSAGMPNLRGILHVSKMPREAG